MGGRDLFAQEQTETGGRNLFAQATAAPAKVRPSLSELSMKADAGMLDDKQLAAFNELSRRHSTGTQQDVMGVGGFVDKTKKTGTVREQMMAELAEDTGFMGAFTTSMGKGFTNVARGLTGDDPERQKRFAETLPLLGEDTLGMLQGGEIETEAMTALETEHPISTAVGEATGEALPFLPVAGMAGGAPSLVGRAAGTGVVTGIEGGLISRGKGGDFETGADIGATIGVGAELLLPVIGKLGRKLFERLRRATPKGAMLTREGLPTPELSAALDDAGMSFEDLQGDAYEFVAKQQPGASPQQVATGARASAEGIPLTKGEVTKDYEQLATEQRLLDSAEDKAAEPLRQFKLKQSEAIRDSLRENFKLDVDTEETGQLIQDALTGRKKLLRTQKNDLYETAARQADDVGGLPLFTDTLADSIPDADLMEDLAITAPQSMKSLDGILTKYGMKDPTEEMIAKGFEPTPLTIKNFERFRKTLNSIQRGDQTGAASVAIKPIIDALDNELMEVDNILTSIKSTPAMEGAAFAKTQKEYQKLSPQLKSMYDKGELFTPAAKGGRMVFHGTSKESKDKILKEGFKTNKETGGKGLSAEGISFGTSKDIAEGYKGGNTISYAMPDDLRIIGEAEAIDEIGGRITADNLSAAGYDAVRALDGKEIRVYNRGKIEGRIFGELPKRKPTKESQQVEAEQITAIRDSLKGARKTVRQLKTEFSPNAITGRLINAKPDGVTPITEASKVYSRLSGAASPVEETRRVMKSLAKAGPKGEQAAASLQATTMMDLIDAGFGTESRKISGERVFNPIAFKRRLDKIGKPKLRAMFANNTAALRKLNNIEKIAADLIPPSGAVPKGSASVLMDLADKVGLIAISAKIPGFHFASGLAKQVTQPIKTGRAVKKATSGAPEVLQMEQVINRQFPGIAAALAIPATTSASEE